MQMRVPGGLVLSMPNQSPVMLVAASNPEQGSLAQTVSLWGGFSGFGATLVGIGKSYRLLSEVCRRVFSLDTELSPQPGRLLLSFWAACRA